jgi:N-acyl-D-amino-acid deacylase
MQDINRREFIKTGALVSAGFALGLSLNNRFTVLIKNGLVVDGTGGVPFRADIGLIGDNIAAIGKLASASADVIIDAKGLAVAPGFIDIHTHTEIELLINPKAESKIRQGVTLEIGGNCGGSSFLFSEDEIKERDERLFKKTGIHITWRDLEGFYKALETSKFALNYATLTGHGDLRAIAVGKNDVKPTSEQMALMKKMLRTSLEQGSVGLSTGLEYAPGSYADTTELIELCKVVSEMNGIYATHIRNEDATVMGAIEEALTISKEANVPVQISHLKACYKANWYKEETMLEYLQNASKAGMAVTADRYPYNAYSTGLSSFLPLWSRQGTNDEILSRLQDSTQIPAITLYAESRGAAIGGWDRVLIASCASDNGKQWQGKTIQQCADSIGRPPFEFVRNILVQERMRVNIIGFAMLEENLKKVLSSPLVMIGSDGSSIAPYGVLGESKPHPRSYGTFARVLGKYCREEKLFDLATAVKKMTSMPAATLNIKKRGVLAKNNFADITIFNPKTVADRATYIDPHQYAAGIEYVIVNGVLTIKKGEHTGATAGVIVKRG